MLRLQVVVPLVLTDPASDAEALESFHWVGDDPDGTIAGAINKGCLDAGLVSSAVVSA